MQTIGAVLSSLLLLLVHTLLPGLVTAQTAQFRIPIWLSDSIGVFTYIDTLHFGLHPNATQCVDDTLGEIFWLTECGLFSQHCGQLAPPPGAQCDETGFPVFLDLRRSLSPAQSDTYRVVFVGTPPVCLHWPDTLAAVYDSCRLYDAASFMLGLPPILNVDMLSTDSAIVSGLGPFEMLGVVIRATGPGRTTGIRQEEPGIPASWELSANYPNPFNPQTRFRLTVPRTSRVRIGVFNTLGQRVTTLVEDELPPGRHDVVWHGTADGGSAVGSGVYLLRVSAQPAEGGNGFSSVRRMILLR